MIIYFSGTGNSKYCAKLLEDFLNDNMLDSFSFIREKKSAKIDSQKPLVFVCPTYSWQIPHVFRDFIKRSNFSGNTDAYFIMTCGSDIGNAEKTNRILCKEKNFSYRGTLEIIMPENYIAMFSAPDKKEASAIIEKAVPVLKESAVLISHGKDLKDKKINSGDKIKSGLVNRLFYPLFVKSGPYKATDKCIGCGKCEKVCPLGNISLKDGKPLWGDECTQCMACINYCPVEAIEYGNKSVGKLRYICPEYK